MTLEQLMKFWPMGMRARSTIDEFTGTVQGYYITREGRPGLVIQYDDKRFVHVYGENWIVQEKRQ